MKRKFILGTDWWTDCDDAVAIRLLARAVLQEDAALLGICINACMDCSLVSLDAYLRAEGLCDVPLAVDTEATDFGRNPPYQARLALLPSRFTDNRQGENPLALYRRLLAEQREPVEILEIGYPQVLRDLLLSPPDTFSPLNGEELVKQKVKHLWMMAGKWDKNGETENNFARNARSRKAGEYLCAHWQSPITFLGFETGVDVITGGNLQRDDLLYQILLDHGSPNGRCSWDPMLVLAALQNDPAQWGYRLERGTARVDGETGQNYFTPCENGNHFILRRLYDPHFYANQINRRISSLF